MFVKFLKINLLNMGVIIKSKDFPSYIAINLDYYQYKKFCSLNCHK